jgi:hypothetical protein
LLQKKEIGRRSWRPLSFQTTVQCLLLALSGQADRPRFCPLSDQSGQMRVLASKGLSANDPQATSALHCGNGVRYDLHGDDRIADRVVIKPKP